MINNNTAEGEHQPDGSPSLPPKPQEGTTSTSFSAAELALLIQENADLGKRLAQLQEEKAELKKRLGLMAENAELKEIGADGASSRGPF